MLNMPPDAGPGEVEALRASILSTREPLQVSSVPWDQLTRRHRAATRRRVAVAAAAVAACAVSLVVALPYARTVSSSEPAGQLELHDSTVGSLATDADFLSALRSHVAGGSQDPRQGQGRADPEDIDVLLATDIPGARLVVVRVGSAPDLTWWIGASGTPVSELRSGNGCTGKEPCWTLYGEGYTTVDGHAVMLDNTPLPPERLGNGMVILAEPRSRVTVRAAPDITAEGAVIRPSRPVQERWPGTFVADLATTAGRLDLEVRSEGDTAPWRGSSATPGQGVDVWGLPGIRGPGIAEDLSIGDVRGDLSAQAQQATIPAGPGSRVLWAEQRQGSATAVIALRAPSGGWAVVVAQRISADASSFWLGTAAVSVRPADEVAAPLAWRWIDPATGAASDKVGVLGPAEATRAAVIDANSRRFEGDLEAGAGTITAAGATTVEFYDASGRQLTRTDVLPAWREGQTLASRAGSG